MTIKNLFLLGSVVAGAAYLQNKGRRDRLFGQARGLIDRAKGRASELAGRLDSKGSAAGSQRYDNNGLGSSVGRSSYDTFDTGIGSSRTHR